MGSKSIIYLNVPNSFDHLIDGEHLQDQTLIATRMTDVIYFLTCTHTHHFLCISSNYIIHTKNAFTLLQCSKTCSVLAIGFINAYRFHKTGMGVASSKMLVHPPIWVVKILDYSHLVGQIGG